MTDPKLCDHTYGNTIITCKSGRMKGKNVRICKKCGTKVRCKEKGDII